MDDHGEEAPQGYAGRWRRDSAHSRRATKQETWFPLGGEPGPLGEVLKNLARVVMANARPATIEEVFDGMQPKWAVAALARCEAAGWVEKAVEVAGKTKKRTVNGNGSPDGDGTGGEVVAAWEGRWAITAEGWKVLGFKK